LPRDYQKTVCLLNFKSPFFLRKSWSSFFIFAALYLFSLKIHFKSQKSRHFKLRRVEPVERHTASFCGPEWLYVLPDKFPPSLENFVFGSFEIEI